MSLEDKIDHHVSQEPDYEDEYLKANLPSLEEYQAMHIDVLEAQLYTVNKTIKALREALEAIEIYSQRGGTHMDIVLDLRKIEKTAKQALKDEG